MCVRPHQATTTTTTEITKFKFEIDLEYFFYGKLITSFNNKIKSTYASPTNERTMWLLMMMMADYVFL